MRQLEELTWPDLAGLDRARAVVFLPISPMEEHGPHLPVGTDFLIARALCERTAPACWRRLCRLALAWCPCSGRWVSGAALCMMWSSQRADRWRATASGRLWR